MSEYTKNLLDEFHKTTRVPPCPTISEVKLACAALNPQCPDCASLADVVQSLIVIVESTASALNALPEMSSIEVRYSR